ncbi:MAG: hypothetical protein GY757_61180, partial [bacterium]|nr:hypothetical protein [bacterium]
QLGIQYKDYAQWKNSSKGNENTKQQEAYWLRQYGGETPQLELPIDYPRPTIQDFEGSILHYSLPAESIEKIRKMALKEEVTHFILLLTSFYILLAKLSGQEEIVVGTPVAGRRHADLEPVIGMFVNTLALRNYPMGIKTIRRFLTEVKDRTLEAFENQDYPFEILVERARVNRDTRRNPLFDVMFTHRDIKQEHHNREPGQNDRISGEDEAGEYENDFENA